MDDFKGFEHFSFDVDAYRSDVLKAEMSTFTPLNKFESISDQYREHYWLTDQDIVTLMSAFLENGDAVERSIPYNWLSSSIVEYIKYDNHAQIVERNKARKGRRWGNWNLNIINCSTDKGGKFQRGGGTHWILALSLWTNTRQLYYGIRIRPHPDGKQKL